MTKRTIKVVDARLRGRDRGTFLDDGQYDVYVDKDIDFVAWEYARTWPDAKIVIERLGDAPRDRQPRR